MAGHRPFDRLREDLLARIGERRNDPEFMDRLSKLIAENSDVLEALARGPEVSFDDYQRQASGFAVYPGQGSLLGLAYAALGLNGEAGETAEQVKKTWRDDGIEQPEQFQISPERREKIIKELGDTLWYAAQVATEIGISLGEVAQTNMTKLAARRAADLIHGEGSDR